MIPNSVVQCRRRVFLLALFALSCGSAAVADSETDQLRAENLRLKAQLQTIQQSCTASATPNVKGAGSIPATPSPATAGPTGTAVVPMSPPSAVLVPAPAGKTALASQSDPQAAGVTAAGEAAAAAIPKGYKLVPVNTPAYIDPLAPPYDRTGCSREMFAGPPPAKWNDADNWRGIYRGESMAEVELAVGKEHFDVSGRGRVEWQYGKCGSSVSGRALFDGGKLISWQVPDLD